MAGPVFDDPADQALFERSGRADTFDPLVVFVYALLSDVPVDLVERSVRGAVPCDMGNGWVAAYAKDVAARLSTNQNGGPMGVMACSRRGCKRVMCHLMLRGRYICTDCYDELGRAKDVWRAEVPATPGPRPWSTASSTSSWPATRGRTTRSRSTWTWPSVPS